MERTQRAGLYSVGVNLLLVATKVALAIVSGSLALAADAIHSLVDVLGSLVVLVGVWLAGRRSRSFPYGLYKVENVVSVILALLIFLAGYEVAREALLAPTREIANVPLTLAGVGLTVAIAYFFSRYERRLGSETGSPSIIADSQHFRADVLSSAVVFAAVLGAFVGLPLDRAGAVVIVLFIARSGWELLVGGMRVLLDASVDAQTLARVREVITADRAVAEIKSLVGRNSGRYKFIEAELVLRIRDLEKAHQASRRIESAIKDSVPHVDRVLIHYEPLHKEVWKWAVPFTDTLTVSSHFGEAARFGFYSVRPTTGEVLARQVLENPYRGQEKQKGINTAEFLIQHGVDGVVVRQRLEGRGPAYVLGDAGVEVLVTQKETEEEVLEEIRHANL
ncbi:MAG: cation diffusion facilitator family transporter [Chloroflexota bacterium]